MEATRHRLVFMLADPQTVRRDSAPLTRTSEILPNMQSQVVRFVSELRVALALQGVRTFGGGWSIDPVIGSESWNRIVDRARHVMRLGFGDAECARAIEVTGDSAQSLWPDDSFERGALRLTLVHIDEELDMRNPTMERYVLLTFPDGMARVRPERPPGPRH